MSTTKGSWAEASTAIHLDSNAPKGGRNMVTMPITATMAVLGMTAMRPRMSSMSRLPIFCSMVPTHKNIKPLEIAWKTIKRMAADMAAGVLMPAQATIIPRLLIVE